MARYDFETGERIEDDPYRPTYKYDFESGERVEIPGKGDDRTLFARANDFMIDTANTAAGLVKSGVDLVAPGGTASQSIADFISGGQESQSDFRQSLRAQHQQLIQEAKAKGDTGVVQMLENYLRNPVTVLLPEAVGTLGPFAAAGRVAEGVGVARTAAQGLGAAEQAAAGSSAALGATSALGGVVGGGGVRGQKFDTIMQASEEKLRAESPDYVALREQGLDHDTAKRQIASTLEARDIPAVGAGAGVGIIAGRMGAESALFGRNPGVARTVGAEVGSEFVEGATQQGAANFAVQGQLPSQKLSEDVLLSGAQEATIAGPGAAIAGMVGKRPDRPTDPGTVLNELDKAGDDVDAMIQTAQRLTFTDPTNWELVDGKALPPPQTAPGQQAAAMLGFTPQAPTIQVDTQGNAGVVPPGVESERATMRNDQRLASESAAQAQADLGLTPDVQRAQEARNAGSAVSGAVDSAMGGAVRELPATEQTAGDGARAPAVGASERIGPGASATPVEVKDANAESAAVPATAGQPVGAPVLEGAGPSVAASQEGQRPATSGLSNPAVEPTVPKQAPPTQPDAVKDSAQDTEEAESRAAVSAETWKKVPLAGQGIGKAVKEIKPGMQVRQGKQTGTVVESGKAPGYFKIDWGGKTATQNVAGLEYRDVDVKPAKVASSGPSAAPKAQEPDFLTELFGDQAEAPAPKAAPAPKKSKMPATVKRAVADRIAEVEQQAIELAAKKYKGSKKQVELAGDGPRRASSMSVSAINEARRDKNLAAMDNEVAMLRLIQEGIDKEGGADRLAAIVDEEWDKAKSAGDDRRKVFEQALLERLGFTSARGAMASNPLSRVIADELEGKEAPKPKAEAPKAVKAEKKPEAEKPADPEKEPTRQGPNGYDFVSEHLLSRVQGAWGLKKGGGWPAVNASGIGARDGWMNFGKDTPHGRYYLPDIDTNVTFDGKGGWRTTDGKKSGKYDPKNLEAETKRVIGELIGKPKDAPAFKRGPEATARTEAVQAHVDKIREKWKNAPEVIVLGTFNDAPEAVRQYDAGSEAEGVPEGFIWRGQVYIVADQMQSEADVRRVMWHESLGHLGLRGSLEGRLDNVLDEVALMRPAEVKKKAKEYGLDFSDKNQRRQASEEVLAELAQTRPELNIVQRAIAIIRKFMRSIGFNMALSDNDIVAQVIIPARQFIENGAGKADANVPSFSRSVFGTEAFEKWFGDSKVVDEDGKPLVVYHGTTADISVFDPQAGFAGQRGLYFTSDPDLASAYAKPNAVRGRTDPGAVYPVFLSIKNPLILGDERFDPNSMKGRLAKLLAPKEVAKVTERDRLRDHLGSGSLLEQRDVDALKAAGYDGVMMEEFGDVFIALDSAQVKSATGNKGTFNPANPDIRFSRTPKDWQASEPGKMDEFIRTMQDKMVDVKRVIEDIRKAGKAIADKWNPYLQETLYHGRTAKQTRSFLDGELLPLLQEMKARKVSLEDLGKYLHARHAEERNVQIAKINPKMPDGGSGMATADAKKYLAALTPDQKRAYDALAKRVDTINKGTTDLLVSSGMEKQETIDAWNATYKSYIPLHRDEVAEAGGSGTGQGFSVRGGSSKRAMGSTKDVIDILANVAMQRERAIVRAEKNRVAQALWGLAAQAPNPDFWLAVDPTKVGQWTGQDLVALGINPVDAKGIVEEPKQRYIDPRTGLVTERVNPALRSADNILSMRVLGEDRFVVLDAKSERAIRMASAVKNLDADQLGRVLSISAKISRYFAAINTQWNPLFGVVNVTRDVQGAMLNLSTTPIAGKQAAVFKQIMPALKGIYIDLRNQRAGKQTNSAWATLFEEFQQEGGQTGFRDMFANSADRAKALESELKKLSEGRAKSIGRAVFSWLSDYNDAMENAVRLSAYKVGKENGMTKQQAAEMAKSLTVNFNRKGTAALQAGALYAFFNASAQGSARLIETLKGPAGKKIIYGGMLLGSMQALMLAAAGFKDDEPPEFIRERNIIIPIGDGKYITIPMPLGLHVIPNLARIPTEFVLSGFKKPVDRIASLFGVFADAFNPIGNAGLSLQTIAPTAIDPIAALAENRDFAGRPIARPDFSGLNPKPGHERAKDTASLISRGVSYGLNLLSGGTDYKPGALSPTPDQIDYLLGQVTGGVGREMLKTMQTASASMTGEELPPHKIPLVGRFFGDISGQSAQSSRYYDNIKQLNGHKAEIDGRKGDGLPIKDYLAENPEYRLIPMATQTQRQISKLRSAKRQLIERGAGPDQIKAIEAQITQRMTALNERMESLEAQ